MKTTLLVLGALFAVCLTPARGAEAPSLHLLLTGSSPYATVVKVADGAECKLHFLVEDSGAADCTILGALLQAGGPLAVPVPQTAVRTERIAVGEGVAVFRLTAALPRRERDVTFILRLDVERQGERLVRRLIRLDAQALRPPAESKTPASKTL